MTWLEGLGTRQARLRATGAPRGQWRDSTRSLWRVTKRMGWDGMTWGRGHPQGPPEGARLPSLHLYPAPHPHQDRELHANKVTPWRMPVWGPTLVGCGDRLLQTEFPVLLHLGRDGGRVSDRIRAGKWMEGDR